MPYGGGVAVRKTHSEVSSSSDRGCLDFGRWSQHLSCTKHFLRVNVLGFVKRRTVASADPTPEKHSCTLIPVFSQQAGCVQGHSSFVPDSGEGQPRDT